MFPLKCSFNEVVGHLIKLIKSASAAHLLLFVLQALEHSAETLQTGHAPLWEAGKDLNQKRKKSKCLHFTHSAYTDCSPMHSCKNPPTLSLDGDRFHSVSM